MISRILTPMLALLAAQPALAQNLCLSLDRLQLIQDAAGAICPQTLTFREPEPALRLMEAQARDRGFSDVETVMLIRLCQSFFMGAHHAGERAG